MLSKDGPGYSFGVDIWAIGIMLFEFATGKLPFSEKNIVESLQGPPAVYELPEFVPNTVKRFSSNFKNFIASMLTK